MSSELWNELLQSIYQKSANECIILNASSSSKDRMRAEKAVGMEFASVINSLLVQWELDRGNVFLDKLPQLLNPKLLAKELNLAGSMELLFPKFCHTLKDTQNFAVIINPTIDENYFNLKVLLAGQLIKQKLNGKTEPFYWAFYWPQTLESIEQLEKNSGIKLSPQIKQMYLRANGSPEIYPHFYALEWLEKGRLAEFYMEFWNEVNITEPIQKLEDFVVIYEDGLGNSQGFFSLHSNGSEEVKIYDWNHETLHFSLWSENFAAWLQRF